VNVFISSELSWPEKSLKLRQETNLPAQQGTKLTIAAEKPSDIAIQLRIPYWTQGGSVKVNGRPLPAFASPSSYLVLRGPWKNGDTIELSLPMGLHSSPMPDDATIQAPMFGPLVLAVRRNEEAPRDRWYGLINSGERRAPGTPPPPLPAADGKLEDATTWIEPVANSPMQFKAGAKSSEATLVPINQIVHERYDVYWKLTPPPPPAPARG